MNWINNVVPPKIRSLLTTRREPPDDFWRKCAGCGQMTDRKALEQNQFVFPCCGHHDRVEASVRLKLLFDKGEYTVVAVPEVPVDPLKFRDGKRYTERLKDARTKTEQGDAVLVGEGNLDGRPIVAAAQDFRFMGGSLGMAAGEAVITAMELAVDKRCPFILFAASGGARMQEGILSLMQMPRATIAVRKLRAGRLPYIVVLTDPTTGGVTASYAMLGDVHIAEPGALICFAGPRVIEQTIREQLPEGFQRAEYLLEHGMIDMVVHRHDLRDTLSRLVAILGASVLAETKRQPHGGARRRLNGNGRYNGSDLDANEMEELARASNSLIEPEPVADDERFEARLADSRRPPVKETAKAKPKAAGAEPEAG
ncbi:MAG: acetyl-CoA carboxylase, carboxyltransferase subunit beta [Hyphomicrobiaceae bacterium]